MPSSGENPEYSLIFVLNFNLSFFFFSSLLDSGRLL